MEFSFQKGQFDFYLWWNEQQICGMEFKMTNFDVFSCDLKTQSINFHMDLTHAHGLYDFEAL